MANRPLPHFKNLANAYFMRVKLQIVSTCTVRVTFSAFLFCAQLIITRYARKTAYFQCFQVILNFLIFYHNMCQLVQRGQNVDFVHAVTFFLCYYADSRPAFQLFAPTIPSAVRPCAFCQVLVSASVPDPKIPSILLPVCPSITCQIFTAFPLLPFLIVCMLYSPFATLLPDPLCCV